MDNEYDLKFNNEIERILKEIYFNPITPNSTDKRAIVNCEYKFVQFLVEKDLVKILGNPQSGKYALILRKNGHEVFEKFKGWDDYRQKTIEQQQKIERAKNLAQRYWWIPIAISLLSLVLASIALFIK